MCFRSRLVTSRPRRGALVLYVAVLMTAFLGVCSFAVDYGRVQMIKTQMQRCADAAARGYMVFQMKYGSGFMSASSMQVVALQYNPIDPGSGIQPTVVITPGYWNTSTNSFTTTSTSYPAVQVTITRTAANGNGVPLLWSRMLGAGSIDLHVTSVAAIMGGNTGSMNFSATSDLYLSGMPNNTTGPYGENFTNNAPYQITAIPVTPGTYVSFTGLSGTSSVVPGTVSATGPAGNSSYVVNHGENYNGSFNNPGPENGIGDAKMPEDALVGLFLTNNAPNTQQAPSGQIDWTQPPYANQAVYNNIVVQQPFMIGAGQTSGGTTQQFLVPPGATRLYVAVWDGADYTNNSGSLSGTVTVQKYIQLMQ